MESKPKVIVALSGGVDSAVSAALLKDQGYEVEGIFMKNWSPLLSQSLTDCPWEQDQADAQAVCDHLRIPFRSINFEKEYKEKVVDYMVAEYAAGRTPNPDVLCNKEIKFAAFLDAIKDSGADFVATGHYAQLNNGRLQRGADPKKDQSYFLYALSKRQLERALFPVGSYPKAEVRALAAQYGLPNQQKKDSQGICFIGHLDLKDFLKGEIGRAQGEVLLLPPYEKGLSKDERIQNAVLVGWHEGVSFHTVGERMGRYIDNRLYGRIRNTKTIQPAFVVAKNIEKNQVYVTDNAQDEHLYSSSLVLERCTATGEDDKVLLVDVLRKSPVVEVQIRYQQPPVVVREYDWNAQSKTLSITLAQKVWAPAEGQAAVLFSGSEVLGGGVLCAIN